jgi:tRNA G10  N-methylase Trm11
MNLLVNSDGPRLAKSFDLDARRRKSLGQYFTGPRLARLLVAIAEGPRLNSAIDPMSGSGDMLAELNIAAPHAQLAGIEIDQSAYDFSCKRFSTLIGSLELIQGDAFNWSTIAQLPRFAYDLVATNPPYVRYQTLVGSSPKEAGKAAQSRSQSIRKGLLETCENLLDLTDTDREIFSSLIRGYSGLSDLAVPSWILCAMLTQIGGRLALIVPHHWLSREYAYIVHYLLLKFFRILYVVEDANRGWFDEAQVKTSLVVAERVDRHSDILSACQGGSYLHVSLHASAKTASSEVGALFPRAQHPEKVFAEHLTHLSCNDDASACKGLSIIRLSLEHKLNDVFQRCRNQKWFNQCEDTLPSGSVRGKLFSVEPRVPQPLLDLLPAPSTGPLTTLESLGVSVGQGLRTGANEFFYCEMLAENPVEYLVAPGAGLGMEPLWVPKAALRSVLRKQSELPEAYIISTEELRGRVFVLDQFIHSDDLVRRGSGGTLFEDAFCLSVMPPSLARLVSTAAVTNMGSPSEPKFIPEMSAVRTNGTSEGNSKQARFWYMLPKFARRHLPDLFIPRVNYRHPKSIMNAPERVVIDANFSTLWLNESATIKPEALLAFLQSSWTIAAMELSATVLGGGALKLEAAHIRHLPIPVLCNDDWTMLSTLGEHLICGTDVPRTLTKVDELIAGVVFGKERAESALAGLRQLKALRLDARKNK